MRNLIKFLWLGLFLMLTACGGGDDGDSKLSSVESSITLNSNTILVNNEESSKIVSNKLTSDGQVEIVLSKNSELISQVEEGKIFYVPSGIDDRFPLGLTGKVVKIDQTNTNQLIITLSLAVFSDITEESSSKVEIPLSKENFIGIISPSSVHSATNIASKSALKSNNLSVLNGGIIFKKNPHKLSRKSFIGDSGIFNVDEIALNLEMFPNKMVDHLSDFNQGPAITTGQGTEESKFIIRGSLKNLKLIENHEFSFKSGLKNLDFRVEGELNVETKLSGNFDALFGYYSRAWREVEKQEFELLGQSVKLSGLKSRDKFGKYPIAGMVFSIPCAATGYCPVTTGQTQTPLRAAKAGGVIIWIYADLNGKITLSGNFGTRVNSGFKIGVSKQDNKKLKNISSVFKSNSSRVIESPYIDGQIELEANAGIGIDADLFIAGIRPLAASIEFKTNGKLSLKTEETANFGINDWGDSWSWSGGQVCISGSMGGGAVSSLTANLGIELDTLISKSTAGSFTYSQQWPTNSEMLSPGWHDFWYTGITKKSCYPSLSIDSPKNFSVSMNSIQKSAIFTWNKINEADYTLYIGVYSGFSKEEAFITKNISGNSTVTISGLDLDKQYYAYVTASKLGMESSPSNEVPFRLSGDTTPPVITLNGDNPYNMIIDTSFVDPGATTTDNIDNNITVTATGSVNTNVAGSYTITYTATDSVGNTATETRIVNVLTGVIDTIPPVITLNGANPMSVTKGEIFTDPGATATDNLDSNVVVVPSGSVNTTVVGEYTITYTATDNDNNTSTKTRTINVIESTVVITPPQNVQVTAGDQKVILTWDVVSGADSYAVYWHDASGVTTSNYLGKKIVLGNNAEVTGLANDKSYYFVVTVFKGAIEGVASIEKNSIPHAGSNWTKEATPPWSARGYHASVVFKNKIWVIGGGNDSGYEKDVWSSLDGISWIKVTDSASWPHLVTSASIVFNNKIWVFADDSVLVDGSYRNGIWSTSDGVSWVRERLAPWTVRQSYRSVVFNNKIWIFGDIYGNDIWSSPDGQVWTKVSTAPWLARLHSAVVFKNKMWVLGGSDYNKNINDVWSSSNGVNWTKVVIAPWSERSMHSSVVFDNKIWVLGGASSEDGLKNDVWSSSDGVSWTEEATASWAARYAHRSLVFNNKIWVIGGRRADNDGGYINDVWSLSNGSVSEIPDEIKVINEKLVIDSELTQELSDSGKNSITNWVAIKDPVNGIKHNGGIVTSFSGDMILSSNAMTRGGGSDGTDGNKLRTGFNMSLYDKNDPNKILTIFLRVKQGKGFLSGLQYNSIFAEYTDSSQNLIKEFPLDNTDGGIGPAKDSCIVSELRTTGQNFSITRNQTATNDKVTVSCGSKSGYFDLESISDSLDGEGIAFNPSDYIVGRVAVRTKISNATVGSKITATFDNIKLNGELVDDFSSGQLSTTLWNYIQHYTQ